MRILYGVMVLFMIINSAYSQNNKNTIIDFETKKPIPYANIRCKNLTNNDIKYTVSNTNGTFLCPFKDITKITISFSGYKTIIDTLNNTSKIFLLKSDIFNLSQIVVTATKTNKKLKDTPVITRVINSKQIGNMGQSDINTILSSEIPGLDFQQAGYGTDINLQGLGAKNILILIDGEILAGENGNNIDYSRINTNNIERIEIVKGASSAIYGSQAMGGVINIITKQPTKKVEINIGFKYKTNNQINYPDLNNNDNYFIHKSSLDLPNLNFNSSVGFNFNKIKSQTNFTIKSFDAYQLKDKHNQYFNIIGTDTTVTKQAETTNINGYNDYSLSQKIKINLSKNWAVNIKGNLYQHNQYDFYMDNKYQQFKDIGVYANSIYKISNNSNIKVSLNIDNYNKYNFFEKLNDKELTYTNKFINPKALFNTVLFNKHNTTIGSEFLNEYLLSDKFGNKNLQDKSVNTSTLFIQDDFNLSDKLNIVTGIRSDYHSTFKLHVSPKLSLMYKYNKHRFRLNYATGFRSPTLKELYMNWDLLGMFTIKGNENLKPETNQYISLSAEYVKNRLNGSINVYKNWFKNKIEGEWQNNQTVYQYVNLGELSLYGVELSLKYNIVKNLNLHGNYSYVKDERSFENQISTISPHTGTVRVEYYLNRPIYNLHINLSGKITGSKDFKAYYGDIQYKGNTIEAWYNVHYTPYSIWNLSISQMFYNSVNIIIGIDNVLDYTADIVNFNTSITPGRRFFISLQMNINNHTVNKLK